MQSDYITAQKLFRSYGTAATAEDFHEYHTAFANYKLAEITEERRLRAEHHAKLAEAVRRVQTIEAEYLAWMYEMDLKRDQLQAEHHETVNKWLGL